MNTREVDSAVQTREISGTLTSYSENKQKKITALTWGHAVAQVAQVA